ncbi:PAS fold-containing protein [Halogranum amylolyticum]|uniref:histidine kinase n=1 Tax=Halogranum amylolyticum TaxID=660520 RepID=A0A1H8NBH0_9EURY|nr:ATP-binding protein [Halogranum amylolyticum]SEO26927.1 PAS fold-containing protein [Halogranum amylolyticum]
MTIESTDGVVLVVEQPSDEVASALGRSLDGLRIESVTDYSTLGSRTGTVDCVVVGPGETSVSTVVEAVRPLDEVPVVVFRPSTAERPTAALDAGASDVVPADGADAVRLLAHRVEATVDRRHCERERAEATNLLDALFERVPLHLYVKDGEGRHLRVSHAYTSDPSKYIGKTDFDLHESEESARTYADDRYVVQENEPILYKREPVVQNDRARFSVDDLQRHYANAMSDDAPTVDRDLFEDGYDGWVLTSKVPWYDSDGEVAGLIGVTVDVSRQEAYRSRLERQNRRLEEFASVVSHDLRNPLNVATGYLELVRETGSLDYLDRVADAHERIDELIDDILSLARGGNDIDDPADVPLDALVRDAWKTVRTRSATLKVVGPLGSVRADETRLRELLENLFRNSVEHGSTNNRTESGDSVEHGARPADGHSAPDDAQDGPESDRPSTEDGEHVVVRVGRLDDREGFYVADDGPGIPEAERERVFEQGVTTSPYGTGFGLAIVRRIAEAHGWSVRIVDADTDAGGARFEFCGVRDVSASTDRTT